LPLLAIGDLWQDGRQAASPNYQVEAFKGLAVNADSACSGIKIEKSTEAGGGNGKARAIESHGDTPLHLGSPRKTPWDEISTSFHF